MTTDGEREPGSWQADAAAARAALPENQPLDLSAMHLRLPTDAGYDEQRARDEAAAMLAELDGDDEPTEYAPAPHGIPAMLDAPGGERVIAEVVIDGRPIDLLAKPPECAHLSFTQQVVVANLVDEATRAHVAWRVQVKVRCAECGVSFRFKRKRIGEPAIVVTADAMLSDDALTLGALIEPIPEGDYDPSWPAIGAPTRAGEQAVMAERLLGPNVGL